MRLLSAEAKVPLNHIRNGTMRDDDWEKLARKMGQVSGAPRFIDDSPNMTMMEIRDDRGQLLSPGPCPRSGSSDPGRRR